MHYESDSSSVRTGLMLFIASNRYNPFLLLSPPLEGAFSKGVLELEPNE
jgi:hypothetical protein